MKILLGIVVVMSFVGCGGSNKSSINGQYQASLKGSNQVGGSCGSSLSQWVDSNIGFVDLDDVEFTISEINKSKINVTGDGLSVVTLSNTDDAPNIYTWYSDGGIQVVSDCTVTYLEGLSVDKADLELTYVESYTVGSALDATCPFNGADCAFSTTYSLD